ncbi:MAG: glycosyltransferase family 4 protein, partial [Candidatus Eremiobacteraeota bacterium]|nr:glycosyltransferase family 4 protein [Candidatus Eremiobacteraeota bacterium]
AIYNGVDAENHFNPANYPPREQLIDSLSLPGNSKIITFIGRITEVKRPQDFVTLAREFKNDPSLFFLMLGDGDLTGFIEDMIKREELSNIKLVGFTDKVPEYLKASHVLILPSITEGLPLTIQEALAMEVPVIASNVGETGTIIRDGYNGFIVEPMKTNQFVEKIKLLLDNPELYEKIKANCKESVIDKFSLERMIKDYEKLFSTLLPD